MGIVIHEDFPDDDGSGAKDGTKESAPRLEPFVAEAMRLLEQPIVNERKWSRSLAVLGLTLALFVLAGLLSFALTDLLLLVVVVMIHELGHYLGMRIFRYRNVEIFFIPLLGAATSGLPKKIEPAKEAMVLLLGPVPGILIGSVLALLVFGEHVPPGLAELLWSAAGVFLLLNIFNLLPILPLDGGRLVQLLLFRRQRYIGVSFHLAGAVALVVLGVSFREWFIAIVGGLLALSVPSAFRSVRVAHELKPELRAQLTEEAEVDRIPMEAAVPIIEAVRRFPYVKTPEVAANLARQVWRQLVARSPGARATATLLTFYVVSLLGSLLIAALFLLVAPQQSADTTAQEIPYTPEERALVVDIAAVADWYGAEARPELEAFYKTRVARGTTSLDYEYRDPRDPGAPVVLYRLLVNPDRSTAADRYAQFAESSLEYVLGFEGVEFYPIDQTQSRLWWGDEAMLVHAVRDHRLFGTVLIARYKRFVVFCAVLAEGYMKNPRDFVGLVEPFLHKLAKHEPVGVLLPHRGHRSNPSDRN